MITIFNKILYLLTSQERKYSLLLLVLIIIMALMDVVGIASILPFMAVLTNPTLIETNMILNNMFQISKILGIENQKQFLFALGVIVFVLLIFSQAVKSITSYAKVLFVQLLEYSIGKRLVEGYLNQPYSWFLSRHSADLGKNILSEIQQITGGGIAPLIELIANVLVATTILMLVIIVDPKLALIVSFSLLGAYGIIYFFLRQYLNQIGKKRLFSNQLRFTAVSEAFSATKEVKVGGLEQTYVESFSNSAQIFARTQALSQAIGMLPRYIFEAIAFGGILLIILYVMSQTGNLNNALPILSLYVFAGYRLMPALQQIYAAFAQITFVGPSLDKLHEDLKNLKPVCQNTDQGFLSFNKSITLNKVYYSYPNTTRTALKNVNLTIPAKSSVGLVGATGSGKTTTVDIILGLLESKKGSLEVDGKVITKKNVRSWQRIIGYVPQHIYLSDDTIAANVAFGVESKNIDQLTVEKVSKIANLHEFINNELPEKYNTKIGERGVRLSGGQRQRIGIARALYHNPRVLILDEATSALDIQTEQIVMEAINNLSKDITIILISHRLNTVKNCDIIFKFEKGQIIK